MDGIKRAINISLQVFKEEIGIYSPKEYIFLKIINPMCRIIFYALIVSYSYGWNKSNLYIISNIFALNAITAFGGMGYCFIIERRWKTLIYIELSQIPSFIIYIYKLVYYFVDGLFVFFINMFFAMIFLNLNIGIEQFFRLTLCAITVAISASLFGMIVGAFGLLLKDINFLFDSIEYFLVFACGINYSTSVLPVYLQKISVFLPITNSVHAVELLIEAGNFNSKILGYLSRELLLGLVFFFIALILFSIYRKLSIKYNSLDLY